MSFNAFLMEGLIEVPQSLLKKLEHEVTTIIFSAARAQVKAGSKLSAKAVEAIEGLAKKHGIKINSKMNPYQERVKRSIENVTKQDLPPKYQGLMDKSTPYVIGGVNDGKLQLEVHLGQRQKVWSGSYGHEKNRIKINLTSLSAFISKAVKTITDPKTIKTLVDDVEDRIESIKGTIEHELTHYLQFWVFTRGNMDIVTGEVASKNAEGVAVNKEAAYYLSAIEFDPMIKSAIVSTVSSIKKLRKVLPKAQVGPVIEYVTGAIKAHDLVKRLDPKDDEITADLLSDYYVKRSTFFFHLKQDPERYKKAVKYLALGVEDRLK